MGMYTYCAATHTSACMQDWEKRIHLYFTQGRADQDSICINLVMKEHNVVSFAKTVRKSLKKY